MGKEMPSQPTWIWYWIWSHPVCYWSAVCCSIIVVGAKKQCKVQRYVDSMYRYYSNIISWTIKAIYVLRHVTASHDPCMAWGLSTTIWPFINQTTFSWPNPILADHTIIHFKSLLATARPPLGLWLLRWLFAEASPDGWPAGRTNYKTTTYYYVLT